VSFRLSLWTSYVGTWVLSCHDSRAAPQTMQTASPVCGTKNFSSLRLYSAPQLQLSSSQQYALWTVDFPARNFATIELTHYAHGSGHSD
jgi:hypothetical protein